MSAASRPDGGKFACVDLNGPRIGDRFVEMEASEGEWSELVEEITAVLGPGVGVGQWLIEWKLPAVTNVPRVFVEQYGEAFGEGKTMRTVVHFRDGRWRRLPDEVSP